MLYREYPRRRGGKKKVEKYSTLIAGNILKLMKTALPSFKSAANFKKNKYE